MKALGSAPWVFALQLRQVHSECALLVLASSATLSKTRPPVGQHLGGQAQPLDASFTGLGTRSVELEGGDDDCVASWSPRLGKPAAMQQIALSPPRAPHSTNLETSAHWSPCNSPQARSSPLSASSPLRGLLSDVIGAILHLKELGSQCETEKPPECRRQLVIVRCSFREVARSSTELC